MMNRLSINIKDKFNSFSDVPIYILDHCIKNRYEKKLLNITGEIQDPQPTLKSMDIVLTVNLDSKTIVTQTDKYRADYYAYYTHGNYWTNPVNYDMTLNSERVGIETCVKLIEQYLIIRGFITADDIGVNRTQEKK